MWWVLADGVDHRRYLGLGVAAIFRRLETAVMPFRLFNDIPFALEPIKKCPPVFR